MKHNYEERKMNRIEKYNELAEKNTEKAKQLYKQAGDMASAIPFGQPILVGHHSENRDRNYRKKIHNKFEKAFETQDKAKYYEQKAESVENNTAISSDDPEAVAKLEKQLESLVANHEFMKAANVCFRKKDKASFLQLKGASEALWNEIMNNEWSNKFNLALNNANIKRVKERIAELKKLSALKTTEVIIKGVTLVQNAEANRVQIIFPERIPNDMYKALRKKGFVFCKSESAFQRQLNSWAYHIAKEFLEQMEMDFSKKDE